VYLYEKIADLEGANISTQEQYLNDMQMLIEISTTLSKLQIGEMSTDLLIV
jgi:hypothetical protein